MGYSAFQTCYKWTYSLNNSGHAWIRLQTSLWKMGPQIKALNNLPLKGEFWRRIRIHPLRWEFSCYVWEALSRCYKDRLGCYLIYITAVSEVLGIFFRKKDLIYYIFYSPTHERDLLDAFSTFKISPEIVFSSLIFWTKAWSLLTGTDIKVLFPW